MADIAQLDLLHRGTTEWNAWRLQSPTIAIDLSRADLRNADLQRADLRNADLRYAILRYANLNRADLRYANLLRADLSRVDLSRSNLSQADLSRSNLSRADLSDANLSDAKLGLANLHRADFINANLSRADLSEATVISTSFGDRDFSQIRGLSTIRHAGPSPLSLNSIYLSEGNIPEAFVRGTGAPDTFLEYMHALTSRPIEHYTCFISYSSKDKNFAQRLYNDLQGNNIRCWYAPEDLKTGDFFWKRIDESIRLYDKLVVVLSCNSVESDWVEREVMAALEKEGQQQRPVLFPLCLDAAIKTASAPWAADVRRRRHSTDFTGWETEYNVYNAGLKRVLRDLKQEKE